MDETSFRLKFLEIVREEFPYVFEVKTDPGFMRGVPDRFLFHMNHWVALEFKCSRNAPRRPNQEEYIELLNNMGYASFVFPENTEEVLDGIRRSFRP